MAEEEVKAPEPPEQFEGFGVAEPTGGSADHPPVYPDDYELVKPPGTEEKEEKAAPKKRAKKDEE